MTVALRLKARSIVTAPASWSPAQLADLGAAAPERVAQPESEEALRDVLIEANVAESPLLLVGGGTALGMGHPLERADLAVSTRGLTRVVEHSPADFVIAVEAGTRVADLQRELAPHHQWLAFEPPDPERATIGGCIASAATSLVASGHGTLRHHLLGLRVLYADARFAKAGGRVVKNVAGYDLMKLHHGALGALGIVVVATLRLRPLPAADLVAWSAVDEPDAASSIVALADLLAQPGYLATGVHFVGPLGPERLSGDLVVRFQGARAAALDQLSRLSTHEVSQRLGTWRRDLLERSENFPRPKILQTLEQAWSRGEEPATIHLSLHYRPSRLKELLGALARFGTGQVALELARGRGFLKLAADGAAGELTDALASKLRALRGELAKLGAAIYVHAGPRGARALLPALSSDEGGSGAAKLVAALRRELDPEGRLNRGRLGPLGDAARA